MTVSGDLLLAAFETAFGFVPPHLDPVHELENMYAAQMQPFLAAREGNPLVFALMAETGITPPNTSDPLLYLLQNGSFGAWKIRVRVTEDGDLHMEYKDGYAGALSLTSGNLVNHSALNLYLDQAGYLKEVV
jgi:hypothetical protein